MTTDARVRDQVVVLNGLRFHYREWGQDGTPPLVLLHGLRSHAHTWDRIAEALAGQFHIFALDQRGRGETEWASDYSLGAMADDLAAFTDALQLDRFLLVGHSLGGRTAFVYLARHPEAVERFVIEDIGPGIEASGDDRIQTGILAAAGASFGTPEDAVRAALAANPQQRIEDVREDTMANLVQNTGGRWIWRYDAAGLAAARRVEQGAEEPKRFGVSEAEAWEALRTIGCPTLLVRGAESDVLGRETAERMVGEMSNCRLVEVAASGHSVHIDNTADYLAAVRTFLLETTL